MFTRNPETKNIDTGTTTDEKLLILSFGLLAFGQLLQNRSPDVSRAFEGAGVIVGGGTIISMAIRRAGGI